ncbi:hypothetical protein NE237_028357 [Protea cynaroides]|uniref:NB-ARC domain-containing protein n=1 Tax=Protea cynaroides TaxID=273540 RepID=A0A9Q0GQ52_9MAGN|nr:hypothetical protein NE237_028357 [Protea cynaroides]
MTSKLDMKSTMVSDQSDKQLKPISDGPDMKSTMVSDQTDKQLKTNSDGSDKLDAKSEPTLGGSKKKKKTLGQSDAEWTTYDQLNVNPISGGDFIDFECRKSVMEEIMKDLMNEEINMIGVYGTGGVGKTALVKEVDRQAKLCENFDEVVMVSLSQDSDDENGIQQKIRKALGLEFQALDTIQREDMPSKTIKNKRNILIILDNIWDRLIPSKIGIAHGREHEGCKILFTTRCQMVCHDMPKKSKTIHLDILTKKDAWLLFNRHAGEVVDFLSSQDVARKVVRECAGIPLALVIVGKALSDKHQSKWEDAAKELKTFEIEAIAGINATLFACLKLSYDCLENQQIKEFFLLCSLFPEELDIPIKKLVMYGIGVGLFKDARSYEEARNTARSMIVTLKDSCLLLPGNISNHVRMHHAVRDCAVLLMSICSQNDSHHHLHHLAPTVRAREGLKKWPKRGMALENCTNVSLRDNDIRRLPSRLMYPQLLIFLLQHNHNLREIPDDFFEGLTSLKVLDLSACFPPFDDASDQQLHSVPLSLLRPLKELRTLCLDQYLRGPLPELGGQQNLEILTLSGSKFITELPREIGQLKNLIKLDLSFCPQMETVHHKTLANLVWLEILYMHCSFRGWWKEGQEVEEEIRGANISFLEITDLPRLKELIVELPEAQHIPEVSTAQGWNYFCIFIGSEHVRDLKLPENLNSKALILNVSINTFPAWFNKVVVENLKTLIYFECMELRDLNEDFDQRKISLVKDLRYLCIRDCPQMEHIINTDNWSSGERFPLNSLEELHLQSLPSLGNIFLGKLQWSFFSKLQVLVVENCQSLTDILLPSDAWKGSAESLILYNLKTLIVRRCHNLRFILPLSVVRGLLQLEYLLVEDCEDLEEIVMEEEVEEQIKYAFSTTRLKEKDDCGVKMLIPTNIIFLPHLKHLQLKTLYNLTNVIPQDFSLRIPPSNRLYVERCPHIENFKIKIDEEEDEEDEEEDDSNSKAKNKKDPRNKRGGLIIPRLRRKKDEEAKGQDNKEENPTSNSQHSKPEEKDHDGKEYNPLSGALHSNLGDEEEKGKENKVDDLKTNSQHSNPERKEEDKDADSEEDKRLSGSKHSDLEDGSDEVEEESDCYSPYLNQTMLPEDCMKWNSSVVNTPLLKNIYNHVSYRARLGEPPVSLKLHGDWKQAYKWGQILMEIPAAAVLIEKAGFKYFLSIKPRNANRQHLSALMERWWADTNTFHFPRLEMGITPSEFCFYTGLRVGGKPMPWNKHFWPDDLAEVASLLNREPNEVVTSCMNVPCSWLLECFGNIDLRVAPDWSSLLSGLSFFMYLDKPSSVMPMVLDGAMSTWEFVALSMPTKVTYSPDFDNGKPNKILKVNWSPFRESMFYSNNSMIRLARYLDRKRVLLVGPGCRTSYLGDHCWMQIHGGRRPFVPASPPPLMGQFCWFPPPFKKFHDSTTHGGVTYKLEARRAESVQASSPLRSHDQNITSLSLPEFIPQDPGNPQSISK